MPALKYALSKYLLSEWINGNDNNDSCPLMSTLFVFSNPGSETFSSVSLGKYPNFCYLSFLMLRVVNNSTHIKELLEALHY